MHTFVSQGMLARVSPEGKQGWRAIKGAREFLFSFTLLAGSDLVAGWRSFETNYKVHTFGDFYVKKHPYQIHPKLLGS